jgi:hypothetical protein
LKGIIAKAYKRDPFKKNIKTSSSYSNVKDINKGKSEDVIAVQETSLFGAQGAGTKY